VPYIIRKSKHEWDGRPYKIINTVTRRVVGSSITRKKAVSSVAHREDAIKNKEEMKKWSKKHLKR